MKIFFCVMLALILASILSVAFNVKPVKSDYTWSETIYIRADGSIEPADAPISTHDNVTYTLTDNIRGDFPHVTSAIIIEKNNIVLDGNGYTIQGENDGIGIELSEISNVTIKNMKISMLYIGIFLNGSCNNSIVGNNITNNACGISLRGSSNTIKGNIVTNHFFYGILFNDNSNYNSIIGNNITNNNHGVWLYNSSNNAIYHNNFINNTHQVSSYYSLNVWDDDYPCGGNYWSDYIGVDLYSGPYQNETGSDGIGDTPYIIDADNMDRYPLMYHYGTQTYKLTITTTIGGTTTPPPGTHTYANGTKMNVTAAPNAGFSFAYWLFDGAIRTENPITIIMDANHTLMAYFVDDIPPEMSEPSQNPPKNVQPNQDVTVTVTVTDYGSGVKNVTLWYSIDNGATWTTLNMTELAANTYQAAIPGYGNCTWITYKIVAYDNAENVAVKDNNGYDYQYHVIPEISLTTILLAPLILTTIITIITPKTKRNVNSPIFLYKLQQFH
ncbi:MAG: NosD domain-containing protein [Candidatus Bathyarchaeia archaeon]